jgi:hypothetical protein
LKLVGTLAVAPRVHAAVREGDNGTLHFGEQDDFAGAVLDGHVDFKPAVRIGLRAPEKLRHVRRDRQHTLARQRLTVQS